MIHVWGPLQALLVQHSLSDLHSPFDCGWSTLLIYVIAVVEMASSGGS